MSKPDETKPNETKPDEPRDSRKGRPERVTMRPTLGRVVIFCTREGDELVQNVALIVKVHDAAEAGDAGVDLQVFFQNGEMGRVKRVHQSEGLELGRWRWPVRE